MAKENKFMPFFYDWEEPFSVLSGDECKELLLAMVRYHRNGTEPPRLSGTAYVVGLLVLPQIRRAKEVSKERAELGRKGGIAKREKTKAVRMASVAELQNDVAESQKNVATNTNTNTNTNTTTNTTTTTESRFAEFWAVYPKKVRKMTAEMAWDALSPDDALTDTILLAVEAQKQSAEWQKEGGQYIPAPANWLNQRRWEDELSSASLGKAKTEQGSFDADEFFEAGLRRTLAEYGRG